MNSLVAVILAFVGFVVYKMRYWFISLTRYWFKSLTRHFYGTYVILINAPPGSRADDIVKKFLTESNYEDGTFVNQDQFIANHLVDGNIIPWSDDSTDYDRFNTMINFHMRYRKKYLFIIGFAIDTSRLKVKIDESVDILYNIPTLSDDFLPTGFTDHIPTDQSGPSKFHIAEFEHEFTLNEIKQLEYITRLLIRENITGNEQHESEFEQLLRNVYLPAYYNTRHNRQGLDILFPPRAIYRGGAAASTPDLIGPAVRY